MDPIDNRGNSLDRPFLASFNESIPDAPIIVDASRFYTVRNSSQGAALGGLSAYVLDFLQMDDGSYLVLLKGNSNANSIISFPDGQIMLGGDVALIHFGQNLSSVDAKVFKQYSWEDGGTPTRTMSSWGYGPRSIIQIDEDTIAMTGVIGYESDQYASIGQISTSKRGEGFFVAKVNISDFSIEDHVIYETGWMTGWNTNNCRIRGYQEIAYSNNRLRVSFNLYNTGPQSSSDHYCAGLWLPDGNGTLFSAGYEAAYVRSTNIIVTLDSNLSFIRAVEVPSPHGNDMGPVFLDDGSAVVLTGELGTNRQQLHTLGINDTSWNTTWFPCATHEGDITPFNSTAVMWSCTNTTSFQMSFFDVPSQSMKSVVIGSHDCTSWNLYRGAHAMDEHHILISYKLPTSCSGNISGISFAARSRAFVVNLSSGQSVSGPSTPFGVVNYELTNGDERSSGYALSYQNMVRPLVRQGTSLVFQSAGYSSNVFQLLTIYEFDSDGDYYADRIDAFPTDATQNSDLDGDGFGDDPLGNNSDDCVSYAGNSSEDRQGCPDQDGDGWSNEGDPFPTDATQHSDMDSDGFGDNVSGLKPDSCPSVFGESSRDRYGCLDRDFDGWSDAADVFPDDSSQWTDRDGDGYGDNANGLNPDGCPDEVGNSTEDRFGCPDSDGDGWSDAGDALPSEPTQWSDRDGDGWGDDESGNLNDTFPLDSTQWTDRDDDGFGDNEFGNNGDACPDVWGISTVDRNGCPDRDDDGVSDLNDAFPDDPTRWQDTDGDGVEDSLDEFPFDPTQDRDRDGDGFGDNDRGSNADKFPDDPSQWSDIDGDGYGDNQTGNNSDAFIADPTQWTDSDGDGYGDNSFGRGADAFPNDPTQWEDQDGDGFGDNLSGNDPDPYLFDFDNDGYNDSIDPLPKLASPGDIDNDGCLDEEDAFPTDFRECRDFDEDGIGDNADPDDDGDGWADTDEIRQDTDPFDASHYPVDVFQLVIPGTTIGLDGWDLIGIFGGVPLFAWILFGFVTRNSRCRKYEDMLKGASTKKELENIALKSEYSLMIRLLGPHQGIRLERLRAELDDALAGEIHHVPEILEPEDITEDQTHIVEDDMIAGTVATGPSKDASGQIGSDGYEWTEYEGTNYFRTPNSGADWQMWKD
jgi:hypothetical protein